MTAIFSTNNLPNFNPSSVTLYNQKSRELAELKADTVSKARDHDELLRRNAELTSQLAESRLELKHNLEELKAENHELRMTTDETASFLEDVEVWKKKYETAAKELEAAAKTARREIEEMLRENAKLKMAKDAVIDAATNSLRGFEKRVAALEINFANLKPALHPSGQPVLSMVPVNEPQSSFGNNAKNIGLLRCKNKPSVTENSFASLPICISDSDDDGEAKGLKRKLDFNDAADHSKAPRYS